ncbi:MAG: ATP-binding protein [Bacteroidales bacterium]
MVKSIQLRCVWCLLVLMISVVAITLSLQSVFTGQRLLNPAWGILGLFGIGGSIFWLFRCFTAYINKVSFLLDAVENDDFSFQFATDQYSRNERFVHLMLNRIKDILFQAKQQSQIREQYYKLILDKSKTGFIVYDRNGHICQSNRAARELLNLPVLKHLIHLDRVQPGFSEWIGALDENESRSREFVTKEAVQHISVRKVSFKQKEELFRIITLNDIRAELDEKELESWIRLTRVLTHEIMNSVAPIRSLSQLLLEQHHALPTESRKGLSIIHRTSENLMDFVDHYRRFARTPLPRKEEADVADLLLQCRRLMISEIPEHIRIYIDLPEDISLPSLLIDRGQITQVLINLMRNATEALQGVSQGHIRLLAYLTNQGRWVIGVANNGSPISDETREQIFIPFFTTKANGSGIGLSISKQIMRNHQGNLQLNHSTTQETLFTLSF